MMASHKLCLLLMVISATAMTSFMGTGTEIQNKGEPEPRVRLRISGMLDGRLEPCGCASGQLGGLARRIFNLRQDKNYDLLIEGGNIVTGGTALDVQKFATTLMVLDMAGYQAVGVGPKDLELPLQDLVDYFSVSKFAPITSDLKPSLPIPEWKATTYREFPAGDTKVRVASLTMSKPAGKTAEAFTLLPPKEAWAQAMADSAKSTLRIAIVHARPEEMATIAHLHPRPDLIIGITGAINEPLHNPDPVDGVPLVYPGIRGRMLLDVTLARIQGKPRLTKYRVIYLRGSETLKGAMEDKNARQMILAHRHDVKDLGIREAMANLKKTQGNRKYVGSEVCGDCHEETYSIWKKTKHSKAWETLEKAEGKRYAWPITHYPDCISCHTDGYGYESGFVNPEKTPELEGVGCESCHGPGSVHVEEETPESIIRSTPGDCRKCHDFEQTPNFDWKKMWGAIEHYEK